MKCNGQFHWAHSHFPGIIIIAFYGSDFQVNGVRLVLLALSITGCANSKNTDNANNASLTPIAKEASNRENGNAPTSFGLTR